jgi:hypothetical protein
MMVPRHPKRNHTTNTLPSGVKSDIQLPVIGLTAYYAVPLNAKSVPLRAILPVSP